MKGFVIVSRGIEDVAAQEIKELINADCEIKEAAVVFSISDLMELCKLCYLSQSVDRALFFLGSFDFADDFFSRMEQLVSNVDFSDWVGKDGSFMVKCQRIGSHDFSSHDVEEKTGEMILGKIGAHKVELERPDTTFFAYIFNNSCYFGIDFSGFDMHKREYNIFLNPRTIRATIAYTLIRIAGYKEGDILLDPFSGSGIIPIEAALFAAKFSVNHYNKDKFAFTRLAKLKATDFGSFFKEMDEQSKKSSTEIRSSDPLLRNIAAAKKNAKIAGIEKLINFSRIDMEWLDTKFKEKSVDIVVSHLPQIPKFNKNAALKSYDEFFYQAEYILKKDSRIAVISNSEEALKKSAEKYNFKITNKRDVWSGKQQLTVFELEINLSENSKK